MCPGLTTTAKNKNNNNNKSNGKNDSKTKPQLNRPFKKEGKVSKVESRCKQRRKHKGAKGCKSLECTMKQLGTALSQWGAMGVKPVSHSQGVGHTEKRPA